MSRMMLMAMVLLGVAFGAGGTWLAGRVAPGELGAADRTRVERVVRDYILANPELLPQAMQKLQDRETGKQIATVRGSVQTPFAGAWMGNPKGDVTVVQFFDYNCTYCRAMLPAIDQLIRADPNVKVVFRELPILAESSRDAARASLAAAAQGRFATFHKALYAGGPVTAASIAAAARVARVDLARPARQGDEELASNLAMATKLGLNGTPAWVVGDQVLSGAVPLDRLQDAVAKARAR